MVYVYAIWSGSSGKFYVGMSQKPDQRLKAHNLGKSRWTKDYSSWQRFYLKEFESWSEARKHEKYLKSGWGRKGLMKVFEDWQRELRYVAGMDKMAT